MTCPNPAEQPRPLICLVTDRHRLQSATLAAADPIELVVEQVREAAEAGIDLVQVRERDLPARELARLVAECIRVAGGTRARVTVNDRIDVALAVGAAGVHLRGDSFGAGEGRRIVPRGFLIGRSVHEVDEAVLVAGAGGVDYLVFGTVFSSQSKRPEHHLVGLSGLERLVKVVRVPVVAIGGITLANAASVARTGAAGVAAIGLFIDPLDADGHRLPLAEAVGALRRAFDTPRSERLP